MVKAQNEIMNVALIELEQLSIPRLAVSSVYYDEGYYTQRVLSDNEYSSCNRTKSSIPFIAGEKDHMS